MSKHSSIEDGSRTKFQLTDSLLKRCLSYEDAEIIEVIEPAIVKCDITKPLKALVYKHAVVSAHSLYVVSSPAKSDTDLLVSLPLDTVVSIDLHYDTPEFLQGQYREYAQHVEVKFKKKGLVDIEKQLLMHAESLSLLSFKRNPSLSADVSNTSFLLNEFGNINNEQSSSQLLSPAASSKFNGRSSTRQLPKVEKAKTKETLKHRPLPKPVSGTEKLNASYTNALKLSESHRHSLPASTLSVALHKSISPSRSMDNLLLGQEKSPKIKPKNLNSSYPLNLPLSKSAVTDTSLQNNNYLNVTSANAINVDAADAGSASLSQSISSKLFQMFKGTNKEQEGKEFLASSYTHSPNSPRSASIQSARSLQESSTTDETDLHDMHIYTLSKNSRLYSALYEAWVQALTKSTLTKSHSLSKAKASMSRKSSLQVERDNMINKFSLLKEQVLQCQEDDELFLLTKEVNFACQKYFIIKKLSWKSSNLVKLYMKKLISLCNSKKEKLVERMDEIDLLILITEFIVHLLEGTELVFYRNAFINENSNLMKALIESVVKPLEVEHLMKARAKNEEHLETEMDELIETWNESRIIFLQETVCVGEQFAWCFTTDAKKCFNTSLIVDICEKNEKDLVLLLDQVMGKIIFNITNGYEFILTGENFVMFYKYMHLINFIFRQLPVTAKTIKQRFQEETKYYLSKAAVLEDFPQNYPISSLAYSLLEKLLKELKA